MKLVLHIMSVAEEAQFVLMPLMHISTMTLPRLSEDELTRVEPPLLNEINQVPWLGYELLTVVTRNQDALTVRLRRSFWEVRDEFYPQGADEDADEDAAAADDLGDEHDGTQLRTSMQVG